MSHNISIGFLSFLLKLETHHEITFRFEFKLKFKKKKINLIVRYYNYNESSPSKIPLSGGFFYNTAKQ